MIKDMEKHRKYMRERYRSIRAGTWVPPSQVKARKDDFAALPPLIENVCPRPVYSSLTAELMGDPPVGRSAFEHQQKWSWRSTSRRCIGCGWLFCVFAEGEDRVRCLGCESGRAR